MDSPDVWTREQLEHQLRELDPRARLVSTRVLRRIVKQEQRAGPLSLNLVHRRSLTVPPQIALRAVEAADLGLTTSEPQPDYLLLFDCPDLSMPRSEALDWIWRRLFHARVHAAVDAKVAARSLDGEHIRQRIASIGQREFAEIRSVLDRDAWLISPRNDTAVYVEFAAVFLELRFFARELLPTYFPGIEDFHAVASLIEGDMDGRALFDQTRPPGAPDPAPHPIEDDRRDMVPIADDAVVRSEVRFRWLLARADRARSLGNVVRSAILRTRAARLVGPSRAGQARSGSVDDLAALSRRLAAALEDESIDSAAFRHSLQDLLCRADRGAWNVEERLLYDLQSICVDQEREIFQVDLWGWLLSGGRRRLKRPLPNQTLIRTSKHLRKFAGRLTRSGINDESRTILTRFLQDAMRLIEDHLRQRFRPLIATALKQADIRPTNLPEQISFDRLTEELLDRVAERDNLTMGEVRDAVARSDLRQPDLSGPLEFVRGDRVLRADRRMAVSLDGVYHPGEIYLRALQSASLVMFGTRVGRWFVRYVALPYGGAVGALLTIQELLGFARIKVELTNRWTVLLLGTFLLLLLHSNRFFAIAKATGLVIWSVVRSVLIDVPAWVLDRPYVRAFLASRAFEITRRLLLEPAASAALTFEFAYVLDHDRRVAASLAALAFVLTTAFLGTPFGREVEEMATDASLRAWRRVRADLLPGLARFILDVFNAVLEAVDRVIYAVDETLRFRSGEGRVSLCAKALLGAIWGIVTYVVRIFINLLVEPTINPIKHFPTVTVAAKMLVPYLTVLVHAMESRLVLLGPLLAGAIAWAMVCFIPGLAGFIVWELKENWKLFEANRPKELQSAVIGHHGETMRRLLLPGFHSGTIPNLFAKLRKVERQAYRTGRHAAARKAHQAIEHIEIPIRHFIERGLCAILVKSGRLYPEKFSLEHVKLATNRVELVLALSTADDRKLRIAFEDENGGLVTRVCDGGFLSGLTDEQSDALAVAIAGTAARAGSEELFGDLPLDGRLDPLVMKGGSPAKDLEAPPSRLIAISWERWVDYWSVPDMAHEDGRPHEVADELTN